MKFVHMADMHFDAPFVALANTATLAEERRLEQRKAMKDIVEYIKNNKILYLFISGDLYEQEYIKKSTIDYINKLFKEIPETRIYITPGNHDPYINNSFYKQYKWNNNVHIFTDKLEMIETTDADIYGYGFNDFYMNNNYSNIEIKNKNKLNILITHGSLDGEGNDSRGYNPLSSKKLKEMGFDYVALGHIHKKSYNDYPGQRIVYPGSTVSLGFDELGERGVVVGEVNKDTVNLNFLNISTKNFVEKTINITEINSEEELIETLNNIEFGDNQFYKLILIGKRNFEINSYKLLSLLKINNIIKIKDETKIKYDIEEVSRQINLKGLFAKKILEKINTCDKEDKQKLLDAFEEGMNVLNK